MIDKHLNSLEDFGLIRMIQQRPEIEYLFRHILVQDAAYKSLLRTDRRLLHLSVANTLERLYPDRIEELASILAQHFMQAEETHKAIEYLLKAGDQARSLCAHQEAIYFYQQALTLLKEKGKFERAARTSMKLGLTYHNTLDFQQAHIAYEESFALWQQAAEVEIPALPPAPHPLRFINPNPPGIDPTKASDWISGVIIDHLFSGLAEQSPKLGIIPDIARRWEVLEEGHKYIFHLRDDVYWSDDTPVTAIDFDYAWKRTLNPNFKSPAANLLYDIKGAKAFHQGEISDPNQIGIQILDAYTLVVELEQPTTYFPYLLGHSVTFPIPKHIVEHYGESWTDVENLVCNGPFILKAWQKNEYMFFVRNPKYHGRFSGNVQEVKIFSPKTEALQMYEADELDVFGLSFLNASEIIHLRQKYTDVYHTRPVFATRYIGFNCSRPPFDDHRVRRAFALTIDKDTLANTLLHGNDLLANGGLIPPNMLGHASDIGLPYDPEQAQALLAEAGYPKGRGFPQVDWFGSDGLSVFGEYLQTQWRELLGINTNIVLLDTSEYYRYLVQNLPQIFHLGWRADYPDPDSMVRNSIITKTACWQDPTYERLIEEARHISDPSHRTTLYQQADKILIEEAIIIPYIYIRGHELIKPWVRKYPSSPIRWWFWKDMVIDNH